MIHSFILLDTYFQDYNITYDILLTFPYHFYKFLTNHMYHKTFYEMDEIYLLIPS